MAVCCAAERACCSRRSRTALLAARSSMAACRRLAAGTCRRAMGVVALARISRRRVGFGSGALLGHRIAGGGLVVASGWALTHGLWRLCSVVHGLNTRAAGAELARGSSIAACAVAQSSNIDAGMIPVAEGSIRVTPLSRFIEVMVSCPPPAGCGWAWAPCSSSLRRAAVDRQRDPSPGAADAAGRGHRKRRHGVHARRHRAGPPGLAKHRRPAARLDLGPRRATWRPTGAPTGCIARPRPARPGRAARTRRGVTTSSAPTQQAALRGRLQPRDARATRYDAATGTHRPSTTIAPRRSRRSRRTTRPVRQRPGHARAARRLRDEARHGAGRASTAAR